MINAFDKTVKKIFVGTKPIKAAMIGEELVWYLDTNKKVFVVVTTDMGWQQPDEDSVIKVSSEGAVTLTAHLFLGTEDVTDRVEDTAFSWTRQSGDNAESDEEWNVLHRNHGKKLVVTNDDIYKRASFACEFKGEV